MCYLHIKNNILNIEYIIIVLLLYYLLQIFLHKKNLI